MAQAVAGGLLQPHFQALQQPGQTQLASARYARHRSSVDLLVERVVDELAVIGQRADDRMLAQEGQRLLPAAPAASIRVRIVRRRYAP